MLEPRGSTRLDRFAEVAFLQGGDALFILDGLNEVSGELLHAHPDLAVHRVEERDAGADVLG